MRDSNSSPDLNMLRMGGKSSLKSQKSISKGGVKFAAIPPAQTEWAPINFKAAKFY